MEDDGENSILNQMLLLRVKHVEDNIKQNLSKAISDNIRNNILRKIFGTQLTQGIGRLRNV